MEEKDLLICAQCWGGEVEKYKGYERSPNSFNKGLEVSHFCLFKRNGEVSGESEAIVVWDFKK